MSVLKIYDGSTWQKLTGNSGLLSDYVAQGNAHRTASFTAAAGLHYTVDIATAAADVTVTFPASASAGDRFRVSVAADDLANGYAVKFALGAHKLHSGTDDDPWWLFIVGDTAEFTFSGDATLGWIVTDDGIQPHYCVMSKLATQSVNSGTATKVTHGAEEIDVGGLGDTSNSRINIRRDGVYELGCRAMMGSLDDGKRFDNRVYVDGAIIRSGACRQYTSAAGYPANQTVVSPYAIAAGSYVEHFVDHNNGSATDVYYTVAAEHVTATLWAKEIRPR